METLMAASMIHSVLLASMQLLKLPDYQIINKEATCICALLE
jgi:hypothetical protein